jgi:hypothetical protein
MFRIIIATLIVAFAVAATAASAQHVKTFKFGPSSSKVSASAPAMKLRYIKMHPGPTTYKASAEWVKAY